jgi:hypothetical protein
MKPGREEGFLFAKKEGLFVFWSALDDGWCLREFCLWGLELKCLRMRLGFVLQVCFDLIKR